MENSISIEDFLQLDIRVGTVLRAEAFPEARKPAIKLWIDLGELGEKKSSAQITTHYAPDKLPGRQVVCVCNLAPRQIGPFISEVLVTGFDDGQGGIVLAIPDKPVPNGHKLH
ncbi:MAG: tRNA-binding protein [Cyclobacteriaceae bacterium]